MAQTKHKIIISGGGTGGHVFPAIAIADTLKERYPETEILFVGAESKLEMQKVPEAGYEIVGLPVSGFARRMTWKNVTFFIKLIRSLWRSVKIVKKFKPDIAVGVGGYASGPLLYIAARKGVPCLIQEQNSYPGITNKILSKDVKTICVAFQNMDRFFPKEKIALTGNPVRKNILQASRDEAMTHFGIDKTKKVVLIMGGSGGAKSMNDAVSHSFNKITQNPEVCFIWQTGKYYFANAEEQKQKYEAQNKPVENVHLTAFISRMDFAYSAADIVVARAGAITVSELCLLKKPAILVPSPNVAEDHQTKNAQALCENNAAWMVEDSQVNERLISKAIELVSDEKMQNTLSENIAKMAKPNAADDIVSEIMKIINN